VFAGATQGVGAA